MSRGVGRAIVFGGAGFLGSHLCDALIERGWSVLCVDNFCTGDPANVAQLIGDPNFGLVEQDVTEPFGAAVAERIATGGCDLVFHLASAASPPAYHRLPIQTLRAGSVGTEQGLRIAESHGARFVLASTSEVYGDPLEHPQTEAYVGHVNPIGPRSVYDEAKRYAEAVTEAYRRSRGVDTGIARIFNSYGPRMQADDGRMIPTFLGQALAGEPLTVTGTGTQTRSVCYVSDTVAGLLALAESGDPGPINLGNPVELTVVELAGMVAELTGTELRVEHLAAVEDDPQRRCPDIRRAVDRLGWRPRVSPEDGLRRTLAWFAERVEAESPRVGALLGKGN
jgi:dTDP-glucose 4,6-dehydratase